MTIPLHGGHTVQLARQLGCAPEDLTDFSSNADTLAAPLTAEIAAAIPNPLHRYPDPECAGLVQAIAALENVDPAEVLPANGSSEAVFLALAGLRPRRALIVGPVFAEYARACQSLAIPCDLHLLDPAADFRFTDLDEARMAASNAELIVVCAPCNPTGAPLADLAARLAPALRRMERTVLVDATYREFLYGSDHFAPLGFTALRRDLGRRCRLVYLQSFTKWACCPGARLGYALARPGEVRRMRRMQPPWTVSQFAQDLGVALLARIREFRARRAALAHLRRDLAQGLERCAPVERVLPSAANFLLCALRPEARAQALAERLLARRLVVRVGDTIPGLAPGAWLRLQVKARQENEALLQALAELSPPW